MVGDRPLYKLDNLHWRVPNYKKRNKSVTRVGDPFPHPPHLCAWQAVQRGKPRTCNFLHIRVGHLVRGGTIAIALRDSTQLVEARIVLQTNRKVTSVT